MRALLLAVAVAATTSAWAQPVRAEQLPGPPAKSTEDAAGGRTPAQVLSPRGRHTFLGSVEMGPDGIAAVSWRDDYGNGPWRVRKARRGGRFGRSLTIVRRAPRGVLVSAARAVYVSGRSLFERRGSRSPRRLTGGVRDAYDFVSVADGAGGGLLATREQLIAVPPRGRARVRRLPVAEGRSGLLAGNRGGRVALASVPGYGRFGEVRLGTTAGTLGPARRVTLAPGKVGNLHVAVAVSRGGHAAIFSRQEHRTSSTIHMALAARGAAGAVTARRVERIPDGEYLVGAAYDGDGRPLAVVAGFGKSPRVVRP